MKTFWNIVINPFTFETGHAIREADGTITKHVGSFKGEWYYDLINGDLVKVIT